MHVAFCGQGELRHSLLSSVLKRRKLSQQISRKNSKQVERIK